jgi:hypothetical protein
MALAKVGVGIGLNGCKHNKRQPLFSDKIISRMVAIRQPTTEFIGSAIV